MKYNNLKDLLQDAVRRTEKDNSIFRARWDNKSIKVAHQGTFTVTVEDKSYKNVSQDEVPLYILSALGLYSQIHDEVSYRAIIDGLKAASLISPLTPSGPSFILDNKTYTFKHIDGVIWMKASDAESTTYIPSSDKEFFTTLKHLKGKKNLSLIRDELESAKNVPCIHLQTAILTMIQKFGAQLGLNSMDFQLGLHEGNIVILYKGKIIATPINKNGKISFHREVPSIDGVSLDALLPSFPLLPKLSDSLNSFKDCCDKVLLTGDPHRWTKSGVCYDVILTPDNTIIVVIDGSHGVCTNPSVQNMEALYNLPSQSDSLQSDSLVLESFQLESPNDILSLLRKAIALEYKSAFGYMTRAPYLTGPDSSVIHDLFIEYAIDEFEHHIQSLIERLQQLGGFPEALELPCNWDTIAEFNSLQVINPNSTNEIIAQAILEEEAAIKVYHTILSYTKDSDQLTNDIVVKILDDEVNHYNVLSKLINNEL